MLDKLIKQIDDRYNREARVYPTILAFLPAIIFILSFSSTILNIYYGLFSDSAILLLIIYFAADIVRNIGKYTEDKTFKKGLAFPTTELLLHKNDAFSKDKKGKIYNKIQKDYDIQLSTNQEELADENEARKKINEVVGQIRQHLRNNPFLLQTNIRYGFWRNLVSVSTFSLTLSFLFLIIVLFIFKDYLTSYIEGFFAVGFLSIRLCRQSLLNFFGFQYADQFYLEYLSN